MINEKTAEQWHEEDLKRIAGFRLMDDDFLNACFADNIEATELVLQITLKNKDIRVKSVETQKTLKNLNGRSLRLDIAASDGERDFNVEVQRADSGAGPRRARYHQSMLDANITVPGEAFDQLPETYIIFITENDVLKGNLPIYTVDRYINELHTSFDDGEHIVFVNGSWDDDSDIGKLMHDFRCTKPEEMYYSVLSEKVRYFKSNEKGVATMCKSMEDMRNEAERIGMAKGMEKGRKDQTIRFAISMLEDGSYSYEQIAKITKLSMEDVKALDEKRSALSTH